MLADQKQKITFRMWSTSIERKCKIEQVVDV